MAGSGSISMNEKEMAGNSTLYEFLPTPLILHSNLQRSTFTDYLGSGFKIRVSEKTPIDSVILPRCGVAVLIVQMPRISGINPNQDTIDCCSHTYSTESRDGHSKDEDVRQETLDQLTERVSSFVKGHRVSVVVVVGAVFGDEEAMVPERREVVEGRLGVIMKAALTKDHTHTLARVMGLNYHQVSVLVDSLGSLGRVARASTEEIHSKTPLSAKTAAAIVAFFNRDTVTV
ncbi:hypothetical protein Hamer_G015408 [Homarus americanus]|uniref:Uncharacterized protein n=1 Tax=Homarus americanus TaxID=6706 RepID=A0A8J5NBP4_HOMAM|nr:hypothetical protein Hamer_G015408 [Homarus americanus]